ncbi:MAG: RES family NAD+ phosphorylase [Legionellales bacterium]|nr:RES family NAD+ phosphorylase [Legionellales bacterium]
MKNNKFLLCSLCFNDHGLKIEAGKIGIQNKLECSHCKKKEGVKLTLNQIKKLAYLFYVRGSVGYSATDTPIIQMNNLQKFSCELGIDKNQEEDARLIEEKIKMKFFPYAPTLWMVGENDKLNKLKEAKSRIKIFDEIFDKYQTHELLKEDLFYRIRKNPNVPNKSNEYDTPPLDIKKRQYYRFDSKDLPVMYGSPSLHVCIHECRVTIEDELYVAVLQPTQSLRILNLTKIIDEGTQYESLDMAMTLLFLHAGKEYYRILRKIAIEAYKRNFHGILYSSYYTSKHTGNNRLTSISGLPLFIFPEGKHIHEQAQIPNYALFGRPIQEGLIKVNSINRLYLQQIEYNTILGPVFSEKCRES